MPLLTRFDPPGDAPELSETQRKAWSEYLSAEFDGNISATGGTDGPDRSQFYNPREESTDEPSIDEEKGRITWQGFPKRMERQYGEGTNAAFEAAEPDALPHGYNPYYRRTVAYRNQDEYLEWRVERNLQKKITRVTFTCEPPELWEAMAEGYPLLYGGVRTEPNAGDRDKVLLLYQQLVGAAVKKGDLFPNNGPYDPWNIWNTQKGIVHLTHQSNTLGAEVNLAAAATILRKRADGTAITDEQELINCSGFGDKDRASDPHIGQVVNQLAAQGYSLTLRNPVGLYIHDVDWNGWTKPGPNGTRIPTGEEFWRVVRGHDKLILRAIYEVPVGVINPETASQMTVSDIQIGGISINYGGQIAKKIRMKLVATGCRKGQSHRRRELCKGAQAAEPAAEKMFAADELGIARRPLFSRSVAQKQ